MHAVLLETCDQDTRRYLMLLDICARSTMARDAVGCCSAATEIPESEEDLHHMIAMLYQKVKFFAKLTRDGHDLHCRRTPKSAKAQRI